MTDFIMDHKHLLVKAFVKKPPVEEQEVIDWLKLVVQTAQMEVIIGPYAHYCTAEGNEGIAAVCGLATSHTSVHIWDKATIPYLNFDIYSCTCFDVDAILNLLKQFDPYFCLWKLMDRNEKIQIIDSGKKQFMKIIDLLSEEEKILYLDAEKTPASERTEEHRMARAKYAQLRRKFSANAYSWGREQAANHTFTLNCIKNRSRKKKLDFDLDREWFEKELENALIKYPKLMRSAPKGSDLFWSPEVDRIDPNLGYIKSNCRIIPYALNKAKWNWPHERLSELHELLSQEINEPQAKI